jgi:hypothetical protein
MLKIAKKWQKKWMQTVISGSPIEVAGVTIAVQIVPPFPVKPSEDRHTDTMRVTPFDR